MIIVTLPTYVVLLAAKPPVIARRERWRADHAGRPDERQGPGWQGFQGRRGTGVHREQHPVHKNAFLFRKGVNNQNRDARLHHPFFVYPLTIGIVTYLLPGTTSIP